MCLLLNLRINLLEIVITAQSIAIDGEPVLKRRQSDSPDIRQLFGSKELSVKSFVQIYCVKSVEPIIKKKKFGLISKSRKKNPYTIKLDKMDIW